MLRRSAALLTATYGGGSPFQRSFHGSAHIRSFLKTNRKNSMGENNQQKYTSPMEAARFTTFNVAHGVIGSHYIGAHFAPDFVNTMGLFNNTLINSVIALIRVRRALGFGPATANQCRNTVLRSIIRVCTMYIRARVLMYKIPWCQQPAFRDQYRQLRRTPSMLWPTRPCSNGGGLALNCWFGCQQGQPTCLQPSTSALVVG